MALTRSLHPSFAYAWLPLSQAYSGAHLAGEPGVELEALVLTDPDGEQHVYPFDAEGKARFLAAGRGGLVVVNGDVK